MTLDELRALPLDTPLYKEGEGAGSSWWQQLEAVAESIPCSGCKAEALSLISGMHDLVNHRLKQPLYNEENFQTVAGYYAQAVLATLPGCSPSQAAAVERCIQDIKARGDTSVNPWAVCQSSAGCALPHRQPAATQEEEDQKFMDRLVEALRKEGKLEG